LRIELLSGQDEVESYKVLAPLAWCLLQFIRNRCIDKIQQRGTTMHMTLFLLPISAKTV
jgi:hypothetical protein